jgi:hypothetical protein
MPIPERRFTIADAMWLVAAAAIALAVGLACLWGMAEDRIRDRVELGMSLEEALGFVRSNHWILPLPGYPRVADIQFAVPCASLVLSMALVLLRLRSPRPPLRCLAQCLGTSACLTALIFVTIHAIETATWAVIVSIRNAELIRPHVYEVLNEVGSHTSAAVATCCILLLVGRDRRFLWDWIEIAGAVLSCVWVTQIFIIEILKCL